MNSPILKLIFALLLFSSTVEGTNLGCRKFFETVASYVGRSLPPSMRARLAPLWYAANRTLLPHSYQGESFSGKVDDIDVTINVLEPVGMGWWGVVHRVTVTGDVGALSLRHPEIFGSDLQVSLVAKFPRRDDVRFGQVRQNGILKEPEITANILSQLRKFSSEEIVVPPMVLVHLGQVTALLKPMVVDGVSVSKLKESGPLTDDQKTKLRSQIYDLAIKYHEQVHETLDLNVDNLFWIPSQKRWGFYELGHLPKDSTKGFLNNFEGLVQAIESQSPK